MKFKLDALHMTLLAALGLELGCAVPPVGSENGEGSEGDGDPDTGDGDGDGDGDPGDGDGDDPDTGDGDGDPDTGDGDGDGDGEPAEPFTCKDPQPILQPDSGLPSGFVQCDGGFIHRSEKLDATDPQGPDDPLCLEQMGLCTTAADCVSDTYGRCVNDPFGGCFCDYGCVSDADCAPDQICAPSGVVGTHSTCIPAECTIDDECGDGLCGVSDYDGCCGTSWVVACADPIEPCHVDSQCPDMACPNVPNGDIVDWQCSYQVDFEPNDGQWTCEPPGWCNCDCGRPFFVEGEARVAPTLARRDWSLAPARELALAPMQARLAEHWTRIGQFEHASVASFARFASQLLRLGAPPKLLRDTARALDDEIEHVRLAFGLASAYAGAPVGPGSLEVGEAVESEMDLFAIVDGLIAEACVGETLAAIEAHEAASWAEDPVVAAVLERIAADEWRHAQLGWRTLAWMLAQGGEHLRRFVVARFEVAMQAVEAHAGSDANLELRRHGVLDEALRAEVRRAGIAKVIRPCVQSLENCRVNSPVKASSARISSQ